MPAVSASHHLLQPIYCEDVQHIHVPQYEALSLDNILECGLAYPEVANALPIIREVRKMPRAYLCNLIYTLVGEEFKKWVNRRCQQRDESIATEQNLNIQLDPKIAEAFLASTAISRKSAHLFFINSAHMICFLFLQNPEAPAATS